MAIATMGALGTPANPFDEEHRPAAARERGTSDDYFGAFSIERFHNAGALQYTHEDAKGWYDYLARFNQANFWYRDAGVKVWAFEEAYDNWEDTYGADAVKSAYYSGHGAMTAQGVFWAPLGGLWDGRSDALSTNMRLGNEQVNYLFWSTCFSLRVLDGHSPIRTWHPANLGFRMLFGFETVSIDHPSYGKFFWEQWNKPQPFWRAWCDASWRISHNQAPSVVAVGADQADATNRLWNERVLSFAHVPRNWYQWAWYNTARGARARREHSLELPAELLIAELRPPDVSVSALREFAERHGIDVAVPDAVPEMTGFTLDDGNGGATLAMRPDGSYEIAFGQPDMGADAAAPSITAARGHADEVIAEHGLDEHAELVFDQVRHTMTAGGNPEDMASLTEGRAVETTVQYRQVINGLPTVGADTGSVEVSFDNRGTLTRIVNGTRQVERLSDRPLTTTASPGEDGPIAQPRTAHVGVERLLAEAWRDQLMRGAARGAAPLDAAPVPGTTEVGYELREGTARLVARREVEVDFGDGLATRYVITAPILD